VAGMKLSKFIIGAFFLMAFYYQNYSQKISAGHACSFFLCANGTAMACGENMGGKLGIGSMSDTNVPLPVMQLNVFKAVFAGGGQSFFLDNSGFVFACGDNSFGQLGIGSFTFKSTFTKNQSINDIISVSAGEYHSLFLKSDGTVYSCGSNQYGQLGIANSPNPNPNSTIIPGLSNVIAISAGAAHSLFLINDGTVFSCGINYDLECGISGANQISVPTEIPGLNNIIAISSGNSHSLFLRMDGAILACGSNNYGELGRGFVSPKELPAVSMPTGIKKISAGTFCSLFLTQTGSVSVCGDNSHSAIGAGSNSVVITPSVIQVSDVSEISTKFFHSLFLTSNGEIWSCGYNGDGQLGSGTYEIAASPAKITGLCETISGLGESRFGDGFVEEITVFPNPFDCQLNINAPEHGEYFICITNIFGEKMLEESITCKELRINTSGLQPGIYLYSAITKGKVMKVGKLVKQ
jgi:alpha-tubulin suppressor-like RCC1 family protein